jgi:hypothetical protein
VNTNHATGGYTPLQPVEQQTFASEADRKRLSGTAAIAFRKLASIWELSNAEAAALLAVSPSTWDRIKKEPATFSNFNQDQLTRVSALVGVYKGLHLLFADAMSDRWIKLRNKGPIFNGRSPIESMMEGGIPRMLDVRRYVDALRGGL